MLSDDDLRDAARRRPAASRCSARTPIPRSRRTTCPTTCTPRLPGAARESRSTSARRCGTSRCARRSPRSSRPSTWSTSSGAASSSTRISTTSSPSARDSSGCSPASATTPSRAGSRPRASPWCRTAVSWSSIAGCSAVERVMAKHTIVLIPGDGIGPEVTGATRRVLEAAGLGVEWVELPAGATADRAGLRQRPARARRSPPSARTRSRSRGP